MVESWVSPVQRILHGGDTHDLYAAKKDIMNALVDLKKTGRGRRAGGATAREPASVMPLWGMLHPDYTAVISQSPE